MKGVLVGQSGEPPASARLSGPAALRKAGEAHGFSAVVDAVLFIAILGFSSVAVLAVALAAPLAIVATALAGAVSAVTARGAKRGGWTVARA